MKRLVLATGIALIFSLEVYGLTRPQKILGVEYCIEEIATEKVDTSEDVNALARAMWGECRGVPSTTQKAAVAWVILNRVSCSEFPNSINDVLVQRNQFNGYSASNPIDEELQSIAADVLARWKAEKNGRADVGRVIPSDYYYFCSNGETNTFTKTLTSGIWDWSLTSPYED